MIRLKLLSLCIILVTPAPGFVTDHSNVFTVDISKMLKFTNFGKYILLENNKSRSKLQKENDILESELLLEEKLLSELRKTLTADEFLKKAIAFDEKVSEIRSNQARKEEILNDQIRKEEAEFFKAIYPILFQIVSEQGGMILLDQRNVVLFDSSVDITQDAIEKINRVLGNGIDVDSKMVE